MDPTAHKKQQVNNVQLEIWEIALLQYENPML